jgi:hypothetical protein
MTQGNHWFRRQTALGVQCFADDLAWLRHAKGYVFVVHCHIPSAELSSARSFGFGVGYVYISMVHRQDIVLVQQLTARFYIRLVNRESVGSYAFLWYCEPCKSLCAMSVLLFVCLFVLITKLQIKGLAIHKTRDFQEDVNVNTYIRRPLYAYSRICFSSTVGKVELDHAPKSTKEHIELCIYIANSAG